MTIIPNINDYITTGIKGRYFRARDSESEIIKIIEFIPSDGDRSSRAGIKVWYPISGNYGFIDSDVFDNYVPCSTEQIERVRKLSEDHAQRSAKSKQPENNIPLSNLVRPPMLHGSQEACSEGEDYG